MFFLSSYVHESGCEEVFILDVKMHKNENVCPDSAIGFVTCFFFFVLFNSKTQYG